MGSLADDGMRIQQRYQQHDRACRDDIPSGGPSGGPSGSPSDSPTEPLTILEPQNSLFSGSKIHKIRGLTNYVALKLGKV